MKGVGACWLSDRPVVALVSVVDSVFPATATSTATSFVSRTDYTVGWGESKSTGRREQAGGRRENRCLACPAIASAPADA